MNADILDKFSTHLKNVLVRAYALAQELRQSAIEPEHLLYALMAQKGSIGSEVLTKLNLSPEDLKRFIVDQSKLASKPAVSAVDAARETSPKLSADSKKTIEKAVLTANMHEHKYVGTEHLLSAVLQVAGAKLEPYFDARGLTTKLLKDQVASVLKSTSKFPDMTETLDAKAKGADAKSPAKPAAAGAKAPAAQAAKKNAKAGKTPALDFFGVDMTAPKYVEKLEDVVGREKEVERMIQVLCRKTKNNPVLLGEPGVGKTAIVEGLARKLASGQVPPALEGKRIISVDLGLIIAGTIYRGEFESRLKQIIDEVKAHPEIVLFIDELHMIMGAGAASGSIDAANILKPSLARGEIRCIGATTLAEYKKHIEADGALDRRFQPITVAEPTPEQAVGILKGLRDSFERFHGVQITDEAIEAAVEYSVRYIQDRFLPDKAIDLVDEAAAMLRVNEGQDPNAVEERALSGQLKALRDRKQQAVVNENFTEALALKEHEKAVEKKLKGVEKARADAGGGATRVTHADVAKVIARSVGVPVEELVAAEKDKLRNLEAKLKERVIGQDEAVKTVAEYVRRARLGLSNPNRPLATFLFMGPSGVGKTELAKVLAETVFHDKEAFVRVDMSEFTEAFNVSKLIGSPAGYVGYRDSNKFTDAVKRRPYSVVLFDELEKAHPDVLNLFLQIFEDGHLTDGTGKRINFKNTIIIMTSNVGSEHLRAATVGFGLGAGKEQSMNEKFEDARSAMMQELERSFRPEFVNRIDKVILFRPLGLETLQKIVKLHMDDLNRRLASEHRVKVAMTDKVAKLLAEKSFAPLQGARGVRKTIQDLVENAVAESLLANAVKAGGVMRLSVKGDEVVVKP